LIAHARLWGFWDVEVAERFRAGIRPLGQRLGQTWSLLVELPAAKISYHGSNTRAERSWARP
jgi:hypothetical protein